MFLVCDISVPPSSGIEDSLVHDGSTENNRLGHVKRLSCKDVAGPGQQIDLRACASGSWRPGSRSIARLPEARRQFRPEQYLSQEFPGRIHGGCPRCRDGLWSLRERLRQTGHAPASSSRFRLANSRPYQPTLLWPPSLTLLARMPRAPLSFITSNTKSVASPPI